jgi:hypothetical protein
MEPRSYMKLSGAERQQRRWQAAEELVTRKRTPAEYKAREAEYDTDSTYAMKKISENTRGTEVGLK